MSEVILNCLLLNLNFVYILCLRFFAMRKKYTGGASEKESPSENQNQ
jgi:hypothetical protein